MQTIVGVLRGGPSREHEVSLKSGAAILTHLPEDRFLAKDIYIDKQGQWYDRGRATTPDRALHQVDVALLGLHGEYGEDGEVQRLLERFGVPYTGSDSFGSYVAMHKPMSNVRVREAGLRTPEFRHVERVEDIEAAAYEVIRTFHQPVVIKPVGWSSSVGVSVVGGYAQVYAALADLFAAGAGSVVVEEYLRGKDATVCLVEGLRGEDLYTTPAYPGPFSRVESEELQRLARAIHRELDLRHYSQSNFSITTKGIYHLETNTLPKFSGNAAFPQSLASVGVSFPDFLTHLVNLALLR